MLYFSILYFVLFNLFFILYLIFSDRGQKEPLSAYIAAFCFGGLSIILILIIDYLFSNSLPGEKYSFFDKSLWSFRVGGVEELIKFVPLAFFIYKKRYFNEHNDGIVYFAICGLTFGLFENIYYSLVYGETIAILRLTILPLFHGITTAIVGFYLAKKKVENTSWREVLLSLSLVVIIHSLYNLGLVSNLSYFLVLSFVLSSLLALFLFVLNKEANFLDLKYKNLVTKNPRK